MPSGPPKGDSLYPYFIKKWDGGGEYYWIPNVDDIQKLCECINPWHKGPWQETGDSTGWFGTKNMPQAITFLKYGWDEVIQAINIEGVHQSIQRDVIDEFSRTRNTEGSQVDVAAFLQGEPECMYTYMPNIQRKKTVKLLVSSSADCGASKDRLRQRGQTIVAVIDWLEKSGYRVRLDVCDTISGWGINAKSSWCIAFCGKEFEHPLDIGRVGFMLGSGAMLGRILFGIEASSEHFRKQFGATFGCVGLVHDELKAEYDYVFEYHTPYHKDIAGEIINQIVSGSEPPAVPLIDTSNTAWSQMEVYDNEVPEIAILRVGTGGPTSETSQAEGTATSVTSGGEGAGSGGGTPEDRFNWTPAKPSPYYRPYKYPLKRKKG